MTTATVSNTKHYSLSYGQPTNLTPPHVIVNRMWRHNKLAAENSVKSLEAEFKRTSKIDNPERWLVLQAELGRAYKEVMAFATEQDIRYAVRSMA